MGGVNNYLMFGVKRVLLILLKEVCKKIKEVSFHLLKIQVSLKYLFRIHVGLFLTIY